MLWAVIEASVAPDERLAGDITLRLTETSKMHEGDPRNHWDSELRLDNKWQWEKWDAGADQWVPLQEWESPTDMNADDATVKYRGKVQWYTTTNPLGHNGRHRLSVVEGNREAGRVTFAAGDDVYKVMPKPEGKRLADVQNLVITNVTTSAGNADYIKFHPASSSGLNRPVISFTIENDGDPTSSTNRYHWWLWIRETGVSGPSNFWTYEGFKDGPGQKSITINATDETYTKDADIQNSGTYAFDIHVQDTKTGDWQGIRSTKISMPSHAIALTSDPNADFTAIAAYTLESGRDASEVKIDFLNPGLEVKSSTDGNTTAGIAHSGLLLYTLSDDDGGGTFRGVFRVKDNYPEINRDHQPKPM